MATNVAIFTQSNGASFIVDNTAVDIGAPYALMLNFPTANITKFHKDIAPKPCLLNDDSVTPVLYNSTSIVVQSPKTTLPAGSSILLNCTGSFAIQPFMETDHTIPAENVTTLRTIVQYNRRYETRTTSSFRVVHDTSNASMASIQTIFALGALSLLSLFF